MSTTTTTPSLTRPYIGSRRNRSYIHPNPFLPSSPLVSDSAVSTDSTSKVLEAIRSDNKPFSSNSERIASFQAEEEKKASEEYLSTRSSFDERQQNQLHEEKAKGFLSTPSSLQLPPSSSSTSSSSSLFFFPTPQNRTPLSDCHPPPSSTSSASASLLKEQQNFHHLHHHDHEDSDWHRLNRENKNNQRLPEEKPEQEEKEQQQQQQQEKHRFLPNKFLSIPSQNFDLSEVPEENNSFSSLYSLSDTLVEQNGNEHRSPPFTSTPTLPPSSSHYRSTNNRLFPSFSSSRNPPYHLKSFPVISSDSLGDQSSTISTVGLITELQRKADACQLDNMSSLSSSSSLRYSSNLGAGTISSHPYDQRISDQGNKYVIQLKTDEYQEEEFTITPRYSSNQLVIDAKHREEDSTGGYIHRELHKIFNIPKHIDLTRHRHSYNKHTQELTIEMPYLPSSSDADRRDSTAGATTFPIRHTTESSKLPSGKTQLNVSFRSDHMNDSNSTSGLGTTATDSTLMRSTATAIAPTYESSIGKSKPFDFDLFHRSAFRPQIVRTTSNDHADGHEQKKLIMSLDLRDYQAEDIKVSIKDRELIVQAERKIETDTRKSRTSFFQSTSLPPQADIEHLQSNYIDGKLIIEAPYLEQNHSDRRLPSTQGNHW